MTEFLQLIVFNVDVVALRSVDGVLNTVVVSPTTLLSIREKSQSAVDAVP